MTPTTVITVSGKEIDLLNPNPSLIDIEDIAHHLSIINRYNGATSVPYSVAQHSVYVSQFCGLVGLLHDAHEAYIGDITTPVKNAVGQQLHDLEGMWVRVIDQKFNLSNFGDVDLVDLEIRDDEMRCLKGLPFPVRYIKRIQPWGWRKAKRKFLEAYERLNEPM